MKILYEQTIDSDKVLGKYVVRGEPEYRKKDGIFVARLAYDLEGLTKQFTSDIESAFQKAGNTIVTTGDGKIWVSAPEKFSLDMQTNSTIPDCQNPSKRDLNYLLTEDMIKTKGTLPVGLFRREKPVYNEKPKVIVTGIIVYAQLTGVEPTPIIEILKTLGYQSEVIPTSKEVEKIAMSILKRMKKPRYEDPLAHILGDYNDSRSPSELASIMGEVPTTEEDGGDWGELEELLGDLENDADEDSLSEVRDRIDDAEVEHERKVLFDKFEDENT